MAAATGLARKLMRTAQLCAMGVSASAGFLSAAAAAAPASGEGAACPAYPWPHDGARGGQKVFMQSDCAACHSMLPYAGLAVGDAAARGVVEATAAEIVVVDEVAPLPAAAATPLHGVACPPDLTVITKKMEELRLKNLYTAEELRKRMALPTPVWLQFLGPYMRTPQSD
ncbi:hypothetical protein ACP70R_028006 [Stipagrostis hirtigluma subsp. patula]